MSMDAPAYAEPLGASRPPGDRRLLSRIANLDELGRPSFECFKSGATGTAGNATPTSTSS